MQPIPVSRRVFRAIRRPRRLILGLGVLVVAAIAYLVVTGVVARRDLVRARSVINQVKSLVLSGDVAGARRELAAAESDAGAAARWTAGPVWRLAAAVPFLGDPLKTVRGIAHEADALTGAVLPRVVGATDGLSPDRLRRAGGGVDLTPLAQAAPAIEAAATGTDRIAAAAAALPADTWLGAADSARREFTRMVDDLRTTLDDASVAARLLPPMLGADGPRRYLVVFQNDAESRGLGGLPGAFAVMRADRGAVTFERFGNDGDITAAARVDLGRDFEAAYGDYGVESLFVNSDMSPDFPAAARIWMSMWQRQTGESLDGAIATDPSALSYLLQVTGATTLPDGTSVTADNVVRLSESSVYQEFPTDQQARKAYLVGLARVVAKSIAHSDAVGSRAFASALGRSVGERRLLVWSARPDEQSLLAGLPLGGVLPRTTRPFTALVVNNGGGNKLDYYLDRSLTYTPGTCTAGTRTTTVTVRLHSTAPSHGLPAYVTNRSDDPPYRPVPGSNRLLVTVYATQGASLLALTLDGQATPPDLGFEQGHPDYTVDVEIAPGQTRTLQLRLAEPRAAGSVLTLRQPLVRPLVQTVTEPRC